MKIKQIKINTIINLHRIEEIISNKLTWNHDWDQDKADAFAYDVISDINFFKDEIVFINNDLIFEEKIIK